MSLKEELKELRRQKREEVKNLHITYIRTKREVKRAASPVRFIRKHAGASMGVAALLGFLLAPKPGPKVIREVSREKAPGMLDRVLGLVKKFLAKAEDKIPEPKSHEGLHAHNGHSKSKSRGMLEALIGVLLSKLDLTRIAAQITRSLMNKRRGRGHDPEVSVADAGTVRPSDFEHFE